MVAKGTYFFVAFIVVLLDQVTKYLARSFIDPSTTINVLPFLQLVSFQNEGAAFGLFQGLGSEVFIVISLAAVTFILYLAVKGERVLWLSLLLGGAIGNLVDRAFLRGVTDFIDVFVSVFHWPAFNIADSAVTIGGILGLITRLKPLDQRAIK